MATSAQHRANRRNARKSTGPKTTAGKLAAAQNSRRHGLSVPLALDLSDPETAEAVALVKEEGFDQSAAQETVQAATDKEERAKEQTNE